MQNVKASYFPALVGLFFWVTFLGCTSKPSWEATFPASGTVIFKGKPLDGADILLFPIDASVPEIVRPRAKSDAEGRFNIWTYQQGDGAPAGEYKVTIVRQAVSISNGTVVAKPNDLPVKYSKLETSDLKIQIAAGKNPDIVIEL